MTTTESLLEEPELVYCDPKACTSSLSKRQGDNCCGKLKFRWRPRNTYLSRNLRPCAHKEEQVVVVFIPNLHCFGHSKFFGFSSFLPLLCLVLPKIRHNTTSICFHFPKLALNPLVIVVRLRSTINLFNNRKHAHDLG